MNKIDEIKKSLAAATPGPWTRYEDPKVDDSGFYHFIVSGKGFLDDETGLGFTLSGLMSKYDAHLVANAPTWLQWCVGEIERLRKALEYYANDDCLGTRTARKAIQEIKGE